MKLFVKFNERKVLNAILHMVFEYKHLIWGNYSLLKIKVVKDGYAYIADGIGRLMGGLFL